MIKDTEAAELVKTLLPLLQDSAKLELPHGLPNFNTDKMLLQTNSVVNSSDVPTPWYTVEMDAAFRTMVPVGDPSLPKGEARVKGAYRNVILPERTYLKTYIQLWSSEKDPPSGASVTKMEFLVAPGRVCEEVVHRGLVLVLGEGPVDGRDVLPFRRDNQASPVPHRVVHGTTIPEDRLQVSFHLPYEGGIFGYG